MQTLWTKIYQTWSSKMNIAESFYIVLKDEYTDKELERIKTIINTLSEFIVIDERSDWERAKVPIEAACKRLEEKLKDINGFSSRQFIPEKIKVITDDD